MSDWRDRIVTDPDVLVGKPTIKGTRISVESILGWLDNGWRIEDILDNYPHVTREDVLAALRFAAEFMHDERCLSVEERLAREADPADAARSEIARRALADYFERRERDRLLATMAADAGALAADPEARAEALQVAADFLPLDDEALNGARRRRGARAACDRRRNSAAGGSADQARRGLSRQPEPESRRRTRHDAPGPAPAG